MQKDNVVDITVRLGDEKRLDETDDIFRQLVVEAAKRGSRLDFLEVQWQDDNTFNLAYTLEDI